MWQDTTEGTLLLFPLSTKYARGRLILSMRYCSETIRGPTDNTLGRGRTPESFNRCILHVTRPASNL